MSTGELLKQRLESAYHWYAGMVNPDTGRFEYIYVPQTNQFVRENCPIREIASVWDVEVLGKFLGRDELRDVVETSLRHYCECLVEKDGGLILDPEHLGEPSSIAHSAFLLLALLHGPSSRWQRQIAGLAEGILRQQRPDGSYKIYFGPRPDEGEELYSGEAMLALMETHRRVPKARYLGSVALGFGYYDADYFGRGRVSDVLLVFFANWQSQAARLLAESTSDYMLRKRVADYVCRIHDRVIRQGFYEDIQRDWDGQSSVKVACALEGLNDAYALVQSSDPARAERYRHCIGSGLDYLLRLQCLEGGTEKERGGFGLSLQEHSQRIDITGHAASAMMKSAANGIEGGQPVR